METEPAAQKIVSVMNSLVSQKYVEPKQPIVTQQSPNGQEEWANRVQQVLRDIEAGKLAKLVLARKLELEANTPFSLTATLQYLLRNYHECTVFAFDNGQSSFVGASPESLVRLEGDVTSLDCLAGTAVRGKTDEEDKAISEELMADSKERREHSTTVTMVLDALSEVCRDLKWDKTPKIIKLRNVQHLGTSFSGRVNPDSDILNLLDLLHPTPAVGGAPTRLALDVIRKIEGDRGWYAAPVGWFDCKREGEFSVAIRSALLSSNRAVLFAGAGIVEGSDPEREFNETELKFQPLSMALARS
jgi:menaquinone-specific isochorismate synthase